MNCRHCVRCISNSNRPLGRRSRPTVGAGSIDPQAFARSGRMTLSQSQIIDTNHLRGQYSMGDVFFLIGGRLCWTIASFSPAESCSSRIGTNPRPCVRCESKCILALRLNRRDHQRYTFGSFGRRCWGSNVQIDGNLLQSQWVERREGSIGVVHELPCVFW
jgi:hypothetical protein